MANVSLPIGVSADYSDRRTGTINVSLAATLVSSLLAAVGVIHLVMVPSHMGEWVVEGIAFILAGWAQAAFAVAIANQPRRLTLLLAAEVNIALIVLWIISRTSGFPLGPHSGHPETVSFIDAATVGMELVATVVALGMVMRPANTDTKSRGRNMSALLPLAVVALTTGVLASPSARNHALETHAGHVHTTATAAGISDGSLAAVAADAGHVHNADGSEVAAVGASASTGASGATGALASTGTSATAGSESTPHVHNADGTTTALIDGQVATAGAATSADGHVHGDTAAASATVDDKGFSKLMNGHQHERQTNPMDSATTVLLAHQLARTADLVAMFPTIADAEAAGYRRQGPYSPGLGTHYGKGSGTLVGDSITDDNVLNPMLIYDGIDPTSKIAGFMYINFGSTVEPPGFAGPNDLWHYHTNVCIVINADGSTDAPLGADRGDVSKSTCDKYGGFLIGNTGYMLHVWTVPGYENSLGVFHEVIPALTCADGTYHTKPLEELGTSKSLCADAP